MHSGQWTPTFCIPVRLSDAESGSSRSISDISSQLIICSPLSTCPSRTRHDVIDEPSHHFELFEG